MKVICDSYDKCCFPGECDHVKPHENDKDSCSNPRCLYTTQDAVACIPHIRTQRKLKLEKIYESDL